MKILSGNIFICKNYQENTIGKYSQENTFRKYSQEHTLRKILSGTYSQDNTLRKILSGKYSQENTHETNHENINHKHILNCIVYIRSLEHNVEN
jgi:hypothetical protein